MDYWTGRRPRLDINEFGKLLKSELGFCILPLLRSTLQRQSAMNQRDDAFDAMATLCDEPGLNGLGRREVRFVVRGEES